MYTFSARESAVVRDAASAVMAARANMLAIVEGIKAARELPMNWTISHDGIGVCDPIENGLHSGTNQSLDADGNDAQNQE